jgi:L-seryl-tRNA(Ser) seleniumtransferase
VSGNENHSVTGFSTALRDGESGSDAMSSARLRNLPPVHAVLSTPAAAILVERFGRAASTDAIRATLESARTTLQEAGSAVPTVEDIAAQALSHLEEKDRSTLRTLFNLSGTVLHTNLGRAALAEAAIEAAVGAMRNPVALEFDLETGKRGERDDHVRALLCSLTGAEDATVVNNNAAAMLLCLNTLANGREAVVSRGELIEIGGAFRMPEIMVRAGAKLVEVGTTNRTHRADYISAVNAETGVILKVHTSNYRVEGFTCEVETRELSTIARNASVPLLHDLGSGALIDLAGYGLRREPTVREALADGADLVTFSGDKLIGGPQAGFIVGSRELITAVNRNPMKRALRVDKMRLAAIEATLGLYRDPDRLAERLPTLRFLTRPRPEIEASAARVLPHVARAVGEAFVVELCECRSQIGSGALPVDTIPSAGLSFRPSAGRARVLEDLARQLRALPTPVVGRIEKDHLVLDLRCLTDEEAFLSNLSHLKDNAAAHTDAPRSEPRASPDNRP